LLTDEPFIAYTCKRPKNIQDILVQSKLNNWHKTGKVSQCNRPSCSHCLKLDEFNSFTCAINTSCYDIRYDMSCKSSDVIYLISCKNVQNKIYIRQTSQQCSQRMNSHIFDINHYPETITNVSKHFNTRGHTIQDFSFNAFW
jgi:hypothetical protein